MYRYKNIILKLLMLRLFQLLSAEKYIIFLKTQIFIWYILHIFKNNKVIIHKHSF